MEARSWFYDACKRRREGVPIVELFAEIDSFHSALTECLAQRFRKRDEGRTGPTGGVGVAFPAGTISLTKLAFLVADIEFKKKIHIPQSPSHAFLCIIIPLAQILYMIPMISRHS